MAALKENFSMDNVHEDLGYRQYGRASFPPSRIAAPRAPRPQPRIDNIEPFYPEKSEFYQWYAAECARTGTPNKLKRN